MENKTKKILIWEGIFIIGILVYLFFATAPKQIYPFSGMTISDQDFKFEIENAKMVILATNENLSNPIILSENTEITLPPGIYYWKVQDDLRESAIKNSTINFEPNLQKQGYFSIINSEIKEMSVVFMVRGNFSEYLVLNEVYSEF